MRRMSRQLTAHLSFSATVVAQEQSVIFTKVNSQPQLRQLSALYAFHQFLKNVTNSEKRLFSGTTFIVASGAFSVD